MTTSKTNSDRLKELITQGYNDWNTIRHKESVSANFSYAEIQRPNLRRFDLSKGNFVHAKIDGANFVNTNLESATLAYASIKEGDFRYAKLANVILNYCVLKKAMFDNANGQNAVFRDADLFRAKFRYSDFSYSDMIKTDLRRSEFDHATLAHTNFYTANLRNASFRNAKLKNASFMLANLTGADFEGADLTGANLQGAQLIGANFTNAIINGSKVFGTSVWQVNLTNCQQRDLIVTRQSSFLDKKKAEEIITVDDLEVAQFIYFILENPNIRSVLDTVTSKVILILGRFTPARFSVLNAIRELLRKKNFLPVVFDFENTANRNLTETVSTLAHLSKFVIADLTDPKSVPHELSHIIPLLPSVPVIPVIEAGQRAYSMFEHFKNFPWVLGISPYLNAQELVRQLDSSLIAQAEQKLSSL